MSTARAKRGGAGRVRIIGGRWRRRQLRVPAVDGLRPTPDRVRETLFNWLGQRLDGLACLDLFAGSGALGFEAASRGAARVVLVERDASLFAALEDARRVLDAQGVEIVRAEATRWLVQPGARFDVVFLDPPFRQNALPAVLDALPPRLLPGARVVVEAEAPVEPGGPWRELRRLRAGQVSVQLLQWSEDEASGLPGHL